METIRMKENLRELLGNGFTIGFSLDKKTVNIRMKARGSMDGSLYGQDLVIPYEYLTLDKLGYIFQETINSFLKVREDNNG